MSDSGASRTKRRGHDWRFITSTMVGWDFYDCRRCGHTDFPTPFGFMPFWKRCPVPASGDSST